MEIVDEEEIPQLVEINSLKRIPVTILTGFLGSGKTTMLNHLLSVNHGKRIAVIENEFSEGLGIEKMIARNGIDGKNLDSFFELNNGCICCSIKDSLLQTLEQLVLHKDRFDYIVIETTGVANPGPIISIFWADDGVDSVLFLDGVVCTVDCINFASCMNSSVGNDIRLQVSYADRILLNKTDLVDASTVAQIEVDLRRMNQLAELKTTVYSRVSPDWVLGINSYSNGRLTSAMAPINGQFESIVCSPCLPAGELRIETPWSFFSNQTHSAQLLTTEGLQFPGKLSVAKLSSFLDQLLYGNENFDRHSGSENMDSTIAQERLMRVYRMKGLLHISKSNKLFLLQGVHDLFDIQPSTFDEGGPFDQSQGLNKIIVIGRSIDREFLYDKFLQCVDSVES